MNMFESGDLHPESINTGTGIEFRIPPTRNWSVMLFLAMWLVGWVMGEMAVISELVSHDGSGQSPVVLGAIVLVWTVAGLSIISVLLWSLAGFEHVVLTSELLMIKRGLFGLGRWRRYRIGTVRRMRTEPETGPRGRLSIGQLWGSGGLIAFDYEASTVRFGQGLDETEASQMVEVLRNSVESNAHNAA